ncbi:MAG: mannose-phosphate guanylyltransferase, partial [Thermoanaerobaculia bacterium]|nr:mannose-phosphate guanylyltransferase [Thermoanaerobaculia bacterium]
SLLQKTYGRVARLMEPSSIFVSTNEQYASKCVAELPLVPEVNILTEPARRNTGPAIAVCCFAIEAAFGDAVIAVLASDAFIADEDEFVRVLSHAYDFAAANDYLVTIGINPTEANTGFGYLELGDELETGVNELRRFAEKPSQQVAEDFLRAGNYLWNAAIFVWRASVFRRALETAAPEIASLADRIVSSGDPGKRVEHYEAMPSISIDYALMEKAPRVAAIRGDFGWSDVGSFEALERAGVPVAELLRNVSAV